MPWPRCLALGASRRRHASSRVSRPWPYKRLVGMWCTIRQALSVSSKVSMAYRVVAASSGSRGAAAHHGVQHQYRHPRQQLNMAVAVAVAAVPRAELPRAFAVFIMASVRDGKARSSIFIGRLKACGMQWMAQSLLDTPTSP